MLRAATSSRATVRGLRVLTPGLQAARPMLLTALVLCFVASGCRHSKSHEREAQKGSPAAPSNASLPPGMDMFDLRAHPNATILHPVDLKTLTESERKFGIAPKRGPKVEYQPDIILMEQGDKAIRSIGTDGMTWTFDANAPHVSEFQMGKIVFATGRAVGRIIYMKREGDEIKAILGPIQLNDVIRNGSFAMDSPIDLNNVIVVTAPDMPEPREAAAADQKNTSSSRKPWDGWNKTVIISRVSKNGKRTPLSMSKTYADGRQESYQRIGRCWSPATTTPAVFSPTHAGLGYGKPQLVRTTLEGQMMMPGAPGPALPRAPSLPNYTVPSSPNMPVLHIPGSDLVAQPFVDSGSIGVQYKYEKNGLSFVATGALEVNNARIRFFLDIGNGKVPTTAGLELVGAVGVRLHLKSHTTQEFHVNAQQKAWLPTGIHIPLGGGPVPFSLMFDQALIVNTGYSAKNSILNAEGDYGFDGGIKAGMFDGKWAVHVPLKPTANVDIGNTVEGISVGINSLVMGAELRAMVGLGVGDFGTGVYATLIFTGTMLRGTDIGLACRQGTIEVVLASGVGYAIPNWVADAVNYVLSFVTDLRIDRVGSIVKGPQTPLFHGCTQVPGHCASQQCGS
jgi:hypothetical protein